ncbi:MAG TPA: ATP phosphoribosyltransferase [Bacteroidales bacterium]|jgi:ATP phosphoribosyltransferase|nr:ATP phosphoribosyltransferase [Bacteroidales bacterium]
MEKLKIAIQKEGRLSEKSLELIRESGIRHNQDSKRKLISLGENFPVEILYLRDDDIPQYVADAVADIGIVGENEVMERERNVEIVERLGFAKCRLSLAIPQSDVYDGLSYFNNKRIATSYPIILGKFLKENDLNSEIHEISGSVEIAPGIGLADAIFDIVSTGSTLISNRLKEVEVVTRSEAVVIATPELNPKRKKILGDLLFRFQAVRRSKNNKYILLNAPNENLEKIVKLLPGMKSPTVLPLYEKGWSSVHSVVNENEFWEIIGKLKEYGAEGILVIPIEKMII